MPTTDGETYSLLALGIVMTLWVGWKLWGARWWLITTRCRQGYHEWAPPQYAPRARADIEEELGSAIAGRFLPAPKVCQWCRAPQVKLSSEPSELVKVVGSWGTSLRHNREKTPWWEPQTEVDMDLDWLADLGVRW